MEDPDGWNDWRREVAERPQSGVNRSFADLDDAPDASEETQHQALDYPLLSEEDAAMRVCSSRKSRESLRTANYDAGEEDETISRAQPTTERTTKSMSSGWCLRQLRPVPGCHVEALRRPWILDG